MSWTYSSLKTAIQDYSESTESTFVTHLDDFIKTSEERILKSVQLDDFIKNVTGTATASSAYLGAPTDFLSPFSLAVIDSSSNYNYLLLKHPSFIRDYTPASATTGTPKYYAEFDENTFILAPTPNSNYTFEQTYLTLLFAFVSPWFKKISLMLILCLMAFPILKHHKKLLLFYLMLL